MSNVNFFPSLSVGKDEPKSLGREHVRATRREMLREPHISPLTDFVEALRAERGFTNEVPYFDPMDGGVNAKVLFILEAPGAKAVSSGFISRNNPDETAKNMFNFLNHVGFDRRESALWNIVPWYIGTGQKIRPARKTDIEQGLRYLEQLLNLLPVLENIVLVGAKAAKARHYVANLTALPIFESPHPSPLFVNNKPCNREVILDAFTQVRQHTSRD
jgi:uracil-DNA glycosylase